LKVEIDDSALSIDFGALIEASRRRRDLRRALAKPSAIGGPPWSGTRYHSAANACSWPRFFADFTPRFFQRTLPMRSATPGGNRALHR
jgi:hypothetical protein